MPNTVHFVRAPGRSVIEGIETAGLGEGGKEAAGCLVGARTLLRERSFDVKTSGKETGRGRAHRAMESLSWPGIGTRYCADGGAGSV